MGNNYQVYLDGGRLLIDAELRRGVPEGDARQRIVALLRQRGLQAELAWAEHVPRLGGKTRRLRPLAERAQVMASVSLLRGPC
jgi:hypothetical protein